MRTWARSSRSICNRTCSPTKPTRLRSKAPSRGDGKLLLVTNTTALDPGEVIARYKSLADIQRGFRVLKSEIEIAPSSTACPTVSAPMP